MAYEFKRNDRTVQTAVRRIARREIEKTLDAMEDGARGDRIHAARKSCKKLRGLIRLVRPAFPAYARENEALRDAARLLSGPRDAAVLIETYDAIMDAFDDEIDRPAMGRIRHGLTLELKDKRAEEALRDRTELFRQNMRAVLERAPGWKVTQGGFDGLSDGLAKTLHRARKALEAAQADPDAASMHEWRKRVKYHWYHARLLEPCFPEVLRGHRKAAKRLADLLGDHHDLSVFAERLSKDADGLGAAESRDLAIGLARRRQASIEAEAFPLGSRLFAEKPKALSRRWDRWWTIWRDMPAEAARPD